MRDVTVIITSCGRLDLLWRTVDSFRKQNTYPIAQYILIEDSGQMVHAHAIAQKYPFIRVISNITNIGQVKSIDAAYSEVRTDYIFHLENDWEFYRSGFIEKSMDILEADEKILTVWLRERNDTGNCGIDKEIYQLYNPETKQYSHSYSLISTHQHGGIWHGMTWNPGLRRTADYKLVAPFSDFLAPGDFAALTECRIGQRYFDLGFRAAIMPEGFVKHIG